MIAIKQTWLATVVAGYVLAASFPVAASEGSRKKCFDPTASPVVIGGNWQLTGTGIDPQVPLAAEQLEVVEFEINGSCGVRVQSGEKGVPLAVVVRDNQTNTTLAATITQELIASGAVALVGGGNSVVAPAAVPPAVTERVPFGINQAAADSLSGCTAAELKDPAVVSLTPIYGAGHCWAHGGFVFRTVATGYLSGTVAARYARETYPALTAAAFLYRDDDFGKPNRDGFRDTFVALGGSIVAEGRFTLQTTGVNEFKSLLRAVTAGNPSMIAANPNVSRLKLLMEAYVQLRDDPTWTAKPANFDNLRFLWTTTATSGTFSDMSPAALAKLVDKAESVQSAWDPDSIAFQKWFALYREFNPAAQPPTSVFSMAAYDATMLIALAMTAVGTTDGATVAAKLREIANPPGICVYPGEWTKAFKLLSKGKKINYEGATGPIDLDERGNATGIPSGVFRYLPDGTSALAFLFSSGAQSACDPDDEDEDD